jgi:hypothetical protein
LPDVRRPIGLKRRPDAMMDIRMTNPHNSKAIDCGLRLKECKVVRNTVYFGSMLTFRAKKAKKRIGKMQFPTPGKDIIEIYEGAVAIATAGCK